MNINFTNDPEIRAGLEAARKERAEIFTGLISAMAFWRHAPAAKPIRGVTA